jgi:phytanoyl-CoA dioxygenase PhyH
MPCQRSTQSTARDFNRQGFIVLPSFLVGPETIVARALVESVLRKPRESACVRPNNTLVPLRWNDAIVQLLLSSDRRMGTLCSAVEADDLKWISGYVSIKDRNSPALWWHQDWWCWDHPVSYRCEAPQIAVLCYLADTDARNGGLRLLPESHRRSMPIHASLPEAHSETAKTLEATDVAMTDHSDQLTPHLLAGDAVVIDYRLLHGTHGNGSNSRRDCILLSFTPSWRRLPEEIKAHLINHPALPSNEDASIPATISPFLPAFNGVRRSLALNRNAPREFAISSSL